MSDPNICELILHKGNEKPKVSIYSLTYNQKDYVRQCLDSILSQKVNFSYELIIYDDNSQDGTKDILREYQAKYPEIITLVLMKENQYSKGFPMITTEHILPYLNGEYVAILEGDDFWTDEYKLQMQADFLDTHSDYSLCVHNCILWNIRTDVKKQMYDVKEDYDVPFEGICQGGSACFQSASVFFRKKYLDCLPKFYFIPKSYDDYTMAMHLSLNGRVRFIAKDMAVYRLFAKGSMSERSIEYDRKDRAEKAGITLKALEEVDRVSGGKYHDCLVNGPIHQQKYTIALMNNNYPVLKSAEFKADFDKEEKSTQRDIFIKYYFKPFHTIYHKLRYQ